MTRTYTRKFDWDQARALREAGHSYETIGAQLGASPSAIWLACHPASYHRGAQRARERQRTGGTCQDCGTTISRNYTNPAQRCRDCWGKSRMKVTDTEAWCPRCQQWLPHSSFPPSRLKRWKEGGSTRLCTPCEREAKADYRARQKLADGNGWNDHTGSTAGQREMLEGTPYEVRAEW